MEEGERDAEHVDDNPEHVEHVVAEGAVHQGTAGRVVVDLRVGGQRPAQKCGAQVDGDAGEPDHEGAKEHALRRVHQQRRHGVSRVVAPR